jgi:hypothetical protein
MKTITQIIGIGGLSWPRSERVSDRYGTVGLIDGNSFDSTDIAIIRPPEGARGQLIAVVKQGRRSSHIGDFFRGIAPPEEPLADGTERVLGSGTVFYDDCEGWQLIGLCPDEMRDSDWLDPHALYDMHESVVELRFEPEA